LARSGSTNDAMAEYATLLKERPDFLSARLALAGLLAQSGRRPEAVEQLREALRQKPASALIQEQLGDIQMADANRGEAVAAWRSALDAPMDSRTRKRIRGKLRQAGER